MDLHFKLLDGRTKSTIRYERVNESTGEEVPWDKIVKGYEYSKNNYVILEEEDFKKAAVEATQTIEIIDFVPKADISDLYFDKPYVLVPQKKAEKGYVLLREVLAKSKRAGIAKVVIRTREYLSAVIAQDSGLVLMLLRFAQELKPLEDFELPKDEMAAYKVTVKEMDLATQLVESQTSKWEPEKYKDEYREELLKWIEAKAEQGELAVIDSEEDEQPHEMATNVIDLADLLRKSVGSLKETKKAIPKRKPKAAKSA